MKITASLEVSSEMLRDSDNAVSFIIDKLVSNFANEARSSGSLSFVVDVDAITGVNKFNMSAHVLSLSEYNHIKSKADAYDTILKTKKDWGIS